MVEASLWLLKVEVHTLSLRHLQRSQSQPIQHYMQKKPIILIRTLLGLSVTDYDERGHNEK